MNAQSLKIPVIVSCVMLLIAIIGDASSGYYTLLRLVVCGTAGLSAWLAKEQKKDVWLWGLILIALVFNPIVPVRFDRDLWGIISFCAGAALFVFYMQNKPR